MAKQNSNRFGKKRKRKSLRRLKRYIGYQRERAGFGCFEEQKDELKKIARSKGMTLSFYINYLIWKDLDDEA
jgi:hypothetical protein